jgi:hypothetical protein
MNPGGGAGTLAESKLNVSTWLDKVRLQFKLPREMVIFPLLSGSRSKKPRGSDLSPGMMCRNKAEILSCTANFRGVIEVSKSGAEVMLCGKN